MKILVIGGAGFIGSHLAEYLIRAGHRVTVFDNLSRGKLKNLAGVDGWPKLKFIRADIEDPKKLRSAMKGQEFVFHFADNTDIRSASLHPKDYVQGNIMGAFSILEAMRMTGVKRIAFPSSTTVFADATRIPTPEDYGPLLPKTLYGGAKLASEGLIASWAHTYGIKAWIFRFVDIVGGRMDHGVLFDFLHKLHKDPARLQILGNGKQLRSFFLVDECVRAMWFVIRRSRDGINLFNIGSTDQIPITRAAQIITQAAGLPKVRFSYTGGSRGWRGDALSNFLDIRKLQCLGWRSPWNSESSLEEATRRLSKGNLLF